MRPQPRHGHQQVPADHADVGQGGPGLVRQTGGEGPDVSLVQDQEGGEGALDTVGHHEPDPVTLLQISHLAPNLGSWLSARSSRMKCELSMNRREQEES